MAPLHDMRRRNWRGRSVVWRTFMVLFMLNARNKCSLRYACTFGFNPENEYVDVIKDINRNGTVVSLNITIWISIFLTAQETQIGYGRRIQKVAEIAQHHARTIDVTRFQFLHRLNHC